MSGGSYDYVSGKMQDAASTLRSHHPHEAHVLALADLLDRVAGVMHDIEWVDSCDTSWTPQLDDDIRAVISQVDEIAESVTLAVAARDALVAALEPRGRNTVEQRGAKE